jgi:hypothetical protein
MVSRKSRYLSLAIPLGDYEPSEKVSERFFETARALGRTTREGIVIPLQAKEPGSRPAVRTALARMRGRTRFSSKSSSVLTPRRFRVAEEGNLLIGTP